MHYNNPIEKSNFEIWRDVFKEHLESPVEVRNPIIEIGHTVHKRLMAHFQPRLGQRYKIKTLLHPHVCILVGSTFDEEVAQRTRGFIEEEGGNADQIIAEVGEKLEELLEEVLREKGFIQSS